MEIDVTKLVTEGDMFDFSGSIAERGQNAAKETWGNAMAKALASPPLTEEQLPEFRDHVRGFGAWGDVEIDSWDITQCNALFIQMVAGDVREAQSLCSGDGPGDIDWETYQAQEDVGGRLFSSEYGKIYYYIGD